MTIAARPGRHWVPDDLPGLPDDGNRYEIVDGELRVSPSPPWHHNTVGSRLARALGDAAPPGLEVVVPGGGVITPRAYLIPDLAVVETAQALDRDHKGDPTRIRLVVEVQSPSTGVDDAREKAVHYAAAGIPSYWRILREPTLEVVVLELQGEGYAEVARGPAVDVTLPFPARLDLGALLS